MRIILHVLQSKGTFSRHNYTGDNPAAIVVLIERVLLLLIICALARLKAAADGISRFRGAAGFRFQVIFQRARESDSIFRGLSRFCDLRAIRRPRGRYSELPKWTDGPIDLIELVPALRFAP